jgi:hypothetical protein
MKQAEKKVISSPSVEAGTLFSCPWTLRLQTLWPLDFGTFITISQVNGLLGLD